LKPNGQPTSNTAAIIIYIQLIIYLLSMATSSHFNFNDCYTSRMHTKNNRGNSI
jgi:hypothetical protein